MESKNFTLRRLELAMPFIGAMKEEDPTAMVRLAALVLADDTSLKLYAAGNVEILNPFIEEVHAMDPFEVAALLANFTAASVRFSRLLRGYPPELLDRMEKERQAKLEAALLPEESPASSEATKQP